MKKRVIVPDSLIRGAAKGFVEEAKRMPVVIVGPPAPRPPERRDGAAYSCPFCQRTAAYVEVTHGFDDGVPVTWTRPVFMCACWDVPRDMRKAGRRS